MPLTFRFSSIASASEHTSPSGTAQRRVDRRDLERLPEAEVVGEDRGVVAEPDELAAG